MRILHISDDLPPFVLSGAGRVAWETAREQKRQGHDVHFLTALPEETAPPTLEGISLHTIPRSPKRWVHYRCVLSQTLEQRVTNIIEELAPNVIHTHGISWHFGYRWFPKIRKREIPCLFMTYGTMHISYGKVIGNERCLLWNDLKRARWEWNPLRNFLIRRYLSHCTHILCVSEAMRRFHVAHGYPQAITLRNGIDVNFWKPETSQEEARKKLSIPLDKTVFLFAGRIGYDKGSNAVVRALCHGELCHPELVEGRTTKDNVFCQKVLVIAAGENSEILKGLPNVLCLPTQDAQGMRTLYAATDVTLIPSVYLDPFPTVSLESMASGRPVIATTYGGAQEAVVDGVTGWVLDPNNIDMFRKQMEWCIEHRSELPVFGSVARKHMKENFSMEGYCQQLFKTYEQAVRLTKGHGTPCPYTNTNNVGA